MNNIADFCAQTFVYVCSLCINTFKAERSEQLKSAVKMWDDRELFSQGKIVIEVWIFAIVNDLSHSIYNPKNPTISNVRHDFGSNKLLRVPHH